MVNKNNRVIKYIFVFLVLIVSYLFLGMLTSLIPSNAIKENVIKSSETLQKDGDKKLYKLGYKEENLSLSTYFSSAIKLYCVSVFCVFVCPGM